MKHLLILSFFFVALSLAQPDGTPRLSGRGFVTTDCRNLGLGVEPPFPNNYLDEVNNYLYPAIRKLQSQRDVAGYYRRTFHFPTTGCVYANFTVNATLPAEYRVGIFQPGVTYPAFLRFSGFDQETQNVTDSKGLAIKLSNVPGTKLLPGFEDDTHHDFVFNAFPVFNFNNETVFAAAILARTELGGGGDRRRSLFGQNYPLNAAIDRAQNANNTVLSQLLMPYHAISPYKFGLNLPSPAVKYRVYPCDPVITAIPNPLPDPNYLTTDMQTRLNAKEHCFYFQLQFQKDPCLHPINDFTVEWPENETEYITVATITIPQGTTVLTDADYTCRHAAMNMWRVLPEHRALGSLSRARLFAMMNSHNQRLALDNAIEPFTGRNHPGLQFWLPEELTLNDKFAPPRIKVNFPGNPLEYVNRNNTGPGARGFLNNPPNNVETTTTYQSNDNAAGSVIYSVALLVMLVVMYL